MTVRETPNSNPKSHYPVNCWYAAGWGHEVSRTPLGRTICDMQIVLYRRIDGTAVALEDSCLHRLLPLSLGQVEGDDLVCGYHGMAFGPGGQCTRMPNPQEKPTPGARIRAIPLVERHALVWVWVGDAGLADPALVPDMHWADDPEWATRGTFLELSCDYRLVVDNLMDLTHEAFVHASSIGHSTIISAPFEVTREGDTVTLSRWMTDCEAPPFLAMQLGRAHGLPPEHVDRWQIIRFHAPSTIVIDVGVAPTGTDAPRTNRAKGVPGAVLNALTPKDEKSCYYFFAFARSFDLDDEALTIQIRDAQAKIFLEDKLILEEQQKAIDRLPERRLLNLGIDKGAVYARSAIRRMIDAEAAVPAA